MSIDPKARAFLAMVADAPPLDTCSVEDDRAQLAAVRRGHQPGEPASV